LQAVVAVHRLGLAREARAVEGGVEEVAAAVAGEHAAGAVGAVRGGGQSDDQQARTRIAEARHGTAPIRPIAKAAHLDARHFLAPRHQPRTSAALDDLAMEQVEPSQEPRVPPRPPPRWLPRGMFCAGPRMPNPREPCESLPWGVPRNPPPPPNLPPPPWPRSCASFTTSARPPNSLPFSSWMAACASSSFSTS